MHSSNGAAEAFASINHKFSQLSKSQTQRCIYKVHKHLRDINEKAYEPDIIAIGPYHHGKDTLQMMEEHKLRYLQLLLVRKNQNVEQYISAIGELENLARNCYGEPISLSQAKFIEMLVLDGCFIIELIKRCNRKDAYCKNDPIFLRNWIMNSLQRDLVLFENQIPFIVLCKLFDLIEAPNQHNRLIYLILYFCQSLYPGPVQENQTNRDSREIKHLLDLIHVNWRPSFDDHNNDVLVDVDADEFRLNRESRFIHSATELTDANVTFSKRKSNTLFDVDFEKGTIVMPPLTIEDRTECFFRNLIAYEQYFPDSRRNFVTEYVRLLDCLINSPRDVEILSECGIIDNWLGENEVVASIVNQLTDSVTGAGKHYMYSGMMDRVNEHYGQPWNRAMAVLSRDYFNSPWAYITFFSAVFLLLLTVVQTVLSVLQVI
ncbi:hypothetical protein CASFOL_003813 [Castilleja foliolosa]|uniref:Uncharacterized protein n=1 Tax=Castilleja foliolosa TaxID=1961234 RepID=A0ABD3EIT0_9LAMI